MTGARDIVGERRTSNLWSLTERRKARDWEGEGHDTGNTVAACKPSTQPIATFNRFLSCVCFLRL